MINTDTMLFVKEVWEGPKVLVIFLAVFQIYLKNFLEEVLARLPGKDVRLEEVTYDTICPSHFRKPLEEKNLKLESQAMLAVIYVPQQVALIKQDPAPALHATGTEKLDQHLDFFL